MRSHGCVGEDGPANAAAGQEEEVGSPAKKMRISSGFSQQFGKPMQLEPLSFLTLHSSVLFTLSPYWQRQELNAEPGLLKKVLSSS